jgi:flagellar hook-associated protein 2
MSKVSSSTLKFSGLASGIDTDAALQQILSADNLRITNTKKNITYLGWKQTAYKDVANSLKTFKSTYFNALKPETNFNSYSMFKKFSSSVKLDGADSTAVTVKAGADANVGSFEMIVKKLAAADKYVSAAKVTTSDNTTAATAATTLMQLGIQEDVTKDVATINVDGTDVKINLTDNTYTIGTVTKGITSTKDAAGDYMASIVANGKTINLNMSDKQYSLDGSAPSIALSPTTVTEQGSTFTINGTTFDINLTTGSYRSYKSTITDPAAKGSYTKFSTSDTNVDVTIKNVMDMVTKSDAGVNMSFNSLSGKVSLESKTEGVANKIKFYGSISAPSTPVDSELLKKLGLGGTSTEGDMAAGAIHTVLGSDAELMIDGGLVTQSSNTFEADGVTFTLNQTTAGKAVKVGLTTDVDGIVTNVKKFVEEYNKIVKSLSDQAKEKRAKTTDGDYYLPLTTDEESEMSESQIKLWNEKAKTGLLYNDSTIKEISSNFRSFLYNAVTMDNGEKISLYQVGITTSSDRTQPGQLVLDEKALKTALEKNPDSVAQLFASEGGIASKMIETIDKAISTSAKNPGSLTLKAGGENTYLDNNFMYSQIKSQNELLARLKSSMESKSDRYSKMFTRLEVAMSKANSQSSMFSSISK